MLEGIDSFAKVNEVAQAIYRVRNEQLYEIDNRLKELLTALKPKKPGFFRFLFPCLKSQDLLSASVCKNLTEEYQVEYDSLTNRISEVIKDYVNREVGKIDLFRNHWGQVEILTRLLYLITKHDDGLREKKRSIVLMLIPSLEKITQDILSLFENNSSLNINEIQRLEVNIDGYVKLLKQCYVILSFSPYKLKALSILVEKTHLSVKMRLKNLAEKLNSKKSIAKLKSTQRFIVEKETRIISLTHRMLDESAQSNALAAKSNHAQKVAKPRREGVVDRLRRSKACKIPTERKSEEIDFINVNFCESEITIAEEQINQCKEKRADIFKKFEDLTPKEQIVKRCIKKIKSVRKLAKKLHAQTGVVQ